MDGIPQQHDNREVYLLHSSQRNSVTIKKKNYNMVNAAKDNSCNVYNSHNNQTKNACLLALKPLVNIIQAAMLQHFIIAYCTFHYAYYNSNFE